MADISGLDSVTCEEFGLEGEDAQQPVDGPLQERQTALPPGPDLGRNQVDHGNLQVLEAAGKPQVEVRAVGKDCYLGSFHFRGLQQLAVFAINSWEMGDYLDQADHGQAGGVHHRANARPLHSGAGATKEFEARIAAAKSFHKSGGIEVPGGLPGRNQDFVSH